MQYRSDKDIAETNVKTTADLILKNPSFDKEFIINGNKISKRTTENVSYVLKPGVVIPEWYTTKTFNYEKLVKDEPISWSRILRKLAEEYPEYMEWHTDHNLLRAEKPELYDEVVTTTNVLVYSKAKVDTVATQKEELPF